MGQKTSQANTTVRNAYITFGKQWKQFDDLYRKAALASGLSASAFEILFSLYDLGEGCLQRDICGYCYSSKQTINTSVHKLEHDGLVRLEPADSGRGMRIYFTPKGRSLAQERVAPFANADLQAFSSLESPAREVLVKAQGEYLLALSDAFDALCETVSSSVKKSNLSKEAK